MPTLDLLFMMEGTSQDPRRKQMACQIKIIWDVFSKEAIYKGKDKCKKATKDRKLLEFWKSKTLDSLLGKSHFLTSGGEAFSKD